MPLLTPGAARFKPLALFKQGRFNVVSLVLDLSDRKERVARLIQLPPGASELALLEGIDRAARMLRGLSHPNLPRFDRIVEGSGGTWLFFQYVEASPLSAYHTVCKSLSDAWVIWWMAELLKALKALHEHSPPVVVGYLEPSDVLVKDHRLILADLGIFEDLFPEFAATTLSRHPQVNFIAPERRMAAQTQPSADLFSAAAIAYWLLTGQEPVVTGPPSAGALRTALLAARPQLSETVGGVIVSSLSFYPSQRPATADAMLEQLTPFVVDMSGKKAPACPTAPGVQKVAVDTRDLRPEEAEAEVEEPATAGPPATDGVTEAEGDEATAPPVSPTREFFEDVLWWLRSHPVLLAFVALMGVIVGAVWLQNVLRPVLPTEAPLMAVASGHVMVRVPHRAAGEPEWVPTQNAAPGQVLTTTNDAVLTFDHGSTLKMSAGSEVECAGRDHDALAIKIAHGNVDVQTNAEDSVVIQLPPGNPLTVPPRAEVELNLVVLEDHPTLDLTCRHGTASLQVADQTVPMGPDTVVHLSPDGKKIVK